MTTIADFYGMIPPEGYTYMPSNLLVLPKCMVGVEIELARIEPLTVNPMYWERKSDGSIREGGWEYVFSQPLFGEDVVNALSNMALASVVYNPEEYTSQNTSTHIHIDARELSAQHIMAMILLYALVEPLIFEAYCPDRKNNIFCLDMDNAKAGAIMFSSAYNRVMTGDVEALDVVVSTLNRYAAMNLDALRRFGSVEFRMFGATTDKHILLKYINICLSIKKAIVEGVVDPLRPYYSYKTRGYSGFLDDVFGYELSREIQSLVPAGNALMQKRLHLARFIANGDVDAIPSKYTNTSNNQPTREDVTDYGYVNVEQEVDIELEPVNPWSNAQVQEFIRRHEDFRIRYGQDTGNAAFIDDDGGAA